MTVGFKVVVCSRIGARFSRSLVCRPDESRANTRSEGIFIQIFQRFYYFMTAFEDILTAEQEAEKSIITAKEEVAEAIAKAKDDKKVRLEEETVKLKEVEKKALDTHRESVKEKTQQIEKEVAVAVTAIEKKFESKKKDLVETLKNKFA